ncbi:MAG TPA: Imm21 family immunity protein [Candidatus Saccharimonadales bacterium]|nr:Imm21 family immunity protein [Candidatus Saccharimonadales bacterium]
MSDFDYLACDGGPHLVLPKELRRQWAGAGSLLAVLSPSSDYGRACAATTNQQMALISVGSGQAMVLANPPLSAWGHSPEGWIDIYYLEAWADTNTDALLKRAIASTPTSAMTDTGKVMTLTESGLILLFAGDKPGSTAYGEYPIPIEPGSYRILEGYWKGGTNEEIYVYRLQPKRT